MDQIVVVYGALCLILLLVGVPLLVQLCVYRSTLLFFISDEWCTFKMLRMKRGIKNDPTVHPSAYIHL